MVGVVFPMVPSAFLSVWITEFSQLMVVAEVRRNITASRVISRASQ